MTSMRVTEAGRMVAFSGLMPETVDYLLIYLAANAERLCSLLPTSPSIGGLIEFNFCLTCSALMSPEFSSARKTRTIPYAFDVSKPNRIADEMSGNLAERPWQAYNSAAHAASLLIDWTEGASLSDLEGVHSGLRAGTLESFCREVVWCLAGITDIVAAATKPDIDQLERPAPFRSVDANKLKAIRKIIQPLRRLIWRLNVGLPEDVLWMSEARNASGRALISRRQTLALSQNALGTYQALRERANWKNLISVLQASGSANAQEQAKSVQKFANEWHMTLRDRAREVQKKRVDAAHHKLIDDFYEAREKDFEEKLEALLTAAGIGFTRYDAAPRTGAFDYVLHIDGRSDFPIECKSKIGSALVAQNEAADVLQATDLHDFPGSHCATVCQPGIDPNAMTALIGSGRLCIVEAHTLADILTRIISERAVATDLHDWLTQPGLASAHTFVASTQSTGLDAA